VVLAIQANFYLSSTQGHSASRFLCSCFTDHSLLFSSRVPLQHDDVYLGSNQINTLPSCGTVSVDNTSSWSVKSLSKRECVAWVAKVREQQCHFVVLISPLAADRRPIDPPPIVQLRVIDPLRKRRPSASGSGVASPSDPSSSKDAVSYAQSFLQNPYYFMFASLAKPDDDAELHWLKVPNPNKYLLYGC
jgi:hypothetical protein